jgi:hypothetical protein
VAINTSFRVLTNFRLGEGGEEGCTAVSLPQIRRSLRLKLDRVPFEVRIVQLGIVSPKIERNTSWAAATLPLVNAL